MLHTLGFCESSTPPLVSNSVLVIRELMLQKQTHLQIIYYRKKCYFFLKVYHGSRDSIRPLCSNRWFRVVGWFPHVGIHNWDAWLEGHLTKGGGSWDGHAPASKCFDECNNTYHFCPQPVDFAKQQTALVYSVNSKYLWHTDLIRLQGWGLEAVF